MCAGERGSWTAGRHPHGTQLRGTQCHGATGAHDTVTYQAYTLRPEGLSYAITDHNMFKEIFT